MQAGRQHSAARALQSQSQLVNLSCTMPTARGAIAAGAAGTLANLSTGMPSNSKAIAAVGGIPPLARLLGTGNADAQSFASAALANLTAELSTCDALAAGAIIPPLVYQLACGQAGAQRAAAKALASLGTGMPPSQEQVGLLNSGNTAAQDRAALALVHHGRDSLAIQAARLE